jgi:hypothetical protein
VRRLYGSGVAVVVRTPGSHGAHGGLEPHPARCLDSSLAMPIGEGLPRARADAPALIDCPLSFALA